MSEKPNKPDLSSEEIQDMKERYQLPEEKVREENPADGYLMGIHFVLSALLPALFGMWLDGILGTKPWMFVVFLLVGFASGFWYVWRRWQKNDE